MPHPLRAAACALLACASTVAQAAERPPVARVAPVTDTHFGTQVVDRYRWMEDLSSPETRGWFEGQAAYAAQALARLPLRDALLARLTAVTTASVRVRNIKPCGASQWMYERTAPDEQEPRLFLRDGLHGAERLALDPSVAGTKAGRLSIGEWAPSPDCRRLAYTLAAGGSEESTLYVRDLATGKDGPEHIDRTRFASISWLPGDRLLYVRSPQVTPGMPESAYYQQLRTYRHRLGDDPSRDVAVFGYGVSPEIPGGLDLIWRVEARPGSRFAIATASTGVTSASEFFVAPLDALDRVPVAWRRLTRMEDEVSAVAIHGDAVFLQSFRDAPRSRVLRASLAHPEHAPEVVVPASEAVVVGIAAQPDALYVQTMAGGDYRILRLDYATGATTTIPLPYPGAAMLSPDQADRAGVNFTLSSWTRSRAHFTWQPGVAAPQPTGLIPPQPVQIEGYEFVDAKVRSHDGVLVPMVIIHRKGLVRDGSHPVLMQGYGAYGVEYTSPVFDPVSLPWLEQGGIMVWTGVRGGGEYGEEWHQAGFQKTKPNTWKDFIACAEYLVAQGYTRPEHIGIQGGSAGGILIGNAIAERPDLFGAAVMRVGLVDMMRAETTANGVGNVPQFGTVTTEDGFRALLAMDAYQKLRDGVAYPPMLLTTGYNDKRVDAWQPGKFAARLQAATASRGPVLLRVDFDAGHGKGVTRDQDNLLTADVYAFLLDQLGPQAKAGPKPTP
jgi:prolyl oligopeptidase